MTIITGGDSGIGRSVAVLFAREGADVAIVYPGAEQADAEVTASAIEAESRRARRIPGDVRKQAFFKSAVSKIVKAFGRLNVLVNNAAFQVHPTFADLTPEHFDQTAKTNLDGYFSIGQAAVAQMNRAGAIVNTGSGTGILSNKDLLDYSMTKAGIHAFTQSLATHLVSQGIRVNAVAPGPVWTPFNPSNKEAADVAKFGADTPMKRPAQPEGIAPPYVFLASAQTASYIAGEVVPILGGSRTRCSVLLRHRLKVLVTDRAEPDQRAPNAQGSGLVHARASRRRRRYASARACRVYATLPKSREPRSAQTGARAHYRA